MPGERLLDRCWTGAGQVLQARRAYVPAGDRTTAVIIDQQPAHSRFTAVRARIWRRMASPMTGGVPVFGRSVLTRSLTLARPRRSKRVSVRARVRVRTP